jgi:hypothetical protein
MNARILAALALLFGALAASPARAKETTLTDILAGLETVRAFRPMADGRTYELPARGAVLKGVGDDFLRRRTPDEILRSGLSTGCGDYAFAFDRLLSAKGYETLYVDAAALDYESIVHHFSGHTAVAVKEKETGNWILVDPTFDRIVSADWDPASRLYAGPAGHFWIGYVGPLEKYAVNDPEALKRFYGDTLAKVPKDVWDKELVRFDFTIDASMRTKDGGYTNPNVLEFIRRPDDVLKSIGATPGRAVKITLKDGGDAPTDDCARGADGAWVCTVSRGARMSAGMTDWLARKILADRGSR